MVRQIDEPDRTVKAFVFLVAAVLLSLSVWLLSDMPSEADIADQTLQRYCEKVRLNNEDPTLGWPDYKRIYDKECDE